MDGGESRRIHGRFALAPAGPTPIRKANTGRLTTGTAREAHIRRRPSISGTADPKLYQTERYNYNGTPSTLTYQFSVPNGNYTVTLKFAEIYDTAAGQRYMNGSLNGTTVFSNLDVWTATGGPNRAYDLSYPVSVTNGVLTITLTCTSSNNSAEVNAIQIVAGGSPQQYYLTTAVNPSGAGSISPASGWYNSGSVVQISASAGSGYVFSGFSGNLGGTTTPQNLTISGPESVTANFTAQAPTITGISPTSGTVGTNVTISGTGFGSSGSVSFNGTAAPIVSWSATTVVAQVPAGATTGPISLSTGAYQTSYQQQQFQVTSIGVTVSPTGATLGQGQTQQFTATVTGTTNQQVTWSVTPTGAWSISTTGLFTAPGTIPAQQIVTVTAASVAQPSAQGSATVTMNPPTPAINSQQSQPPGLSLTQGPPQVGLTISGANFGAAQPCAYAPPNNMSQNGCVMLTGASIGTIALPVINSSWTASSIQVQLPASTPTPPAGQTYAGQIYVVTAGGTSSNQVSFSVSAPFGCNF